MRTKATITIKKQVFKSKLNWGGGVFLTDRQSKEIPTGRFRTEN